MAPAHARRPDRPCGPRFCGSYGNVVMPGRRARHDVEDTAPRRPTASPSLCGTARTTTPHPATGEEVPDVPRDAVYDYPNARPAEWPEADFIVGNPPFVVARADAGCARRRLTGRHPCTPTLFRSPARIGLRDVLVAPAPPRPFEPMRRAVRAHHDEPLSQTQSRRVVAYHLAAEPAARARRRHSGPPVGGRRVRRGSSASR